MKKLLTILFFVSILNTLYSQTITTNTIYLWNNGTGLKEMASPATPSLNYGKLFAKTDGHVYWINDVGAEFDLTAGAGGSTISTFGNGLSFSAGTLSLVTQMSITTDASGLKLVNDATSPGNNKFYKTNSSGVKGWGGIKKVDTDDLDPNEILFGDPAGTGQVFQNNNIVTDNANTRVGVGVAVPLATLHVKGPTNNTGAGYPFYIETSTGNNILTVNDQATFQLGSENFSVGTQVKLYGPVLTTNTFEGVLIHEGLNQIFRFGRVTDGVNWFDDFVIEAVGPSSSETGGITIGYAAGEIKFKQQLFEYDGVVPSDGDLLYGDGGAYDVLPLGSASQVLKVNSAGTQVEWGALSTMLGGSLSATINASTTAYGTVFSTMGFNANENNRQMIMPYAGTMRDLYLFSTNAQSATGNLVIALRKNGVSQTLTVTIAAGEAGGLKTDLVNSFSFVAGDLISIQFINNATASSANILSWSARITQ